MLALPALCGPQLLDHSAASLFRLLLLAPLLEEWIMRAGLQEWLMRRRLHAALVLGVPALAFGLLHVASGWQAMAAVLLPGLASGLLYRRWRDWRLCALVHALGNGFALSFCNFSNY
ncbi:JDVT-CTERM system glutamic-type intramembrane protease MrtJ [Massilia scottii]|uniref:JDVT-CTERM system glutamic-type intramembrane protease MrtJ n=1 Tax=Massilia scottii TaxID=3057166 RepID=UPI0027966170|nr:JDVT-CTERM system glutamic-type intramembrane protease [Massilia sp. CCM 9029]MDQ1829327.1 JDVT-CTERM system glutamic-type intramembrane protease [Massilia sp. CCM 9029]